MTKLRNINLRNSGRSAGRWSGSSETGGAPNVTQCTRRKQPVSELSPDDAADVVANIWEYSSAAIAPPAEWPVISNEYDARRGFSSSSCRSRAATGPIIFRATLRNPA